jgi:hypothetical protein
MYADHGVEALQILLLNIVSSAALLPILCKISHCEKDYMRNFHTGQIENT